MKVLFVCKYNYFRSKFAEAIFNTIANNPTYIARSAGTDTTTVASDAVLNEINTVAHEFGYRLTSGRQIINPEIISWADIVINVADDVSLGNHKNQLEWRIEDSPAPLDINSRRRIVKNIETVVAEFISETLVD